MKKIVLLILFVFVSAVPQGEASYTIDGDVNDWGIDLNAAINQGYLDTNTPTGGNDIDYITEDNADSNSSSNTNVGPGYTTGNTYDAEAAYFDNDMDYVYVAIITGLQQLGDPYPPGDIFFEVGALVDPFSSAYSPTAKSFAIDIATSSLYSVGSWDPVRYSQHDIASPWQIGRDDAGAIKSDNLFLLDLGSDFIYSTDPNNTSHYVMEAKIPMSVLGLGFGQADDDEVWTHWTMRCGNDYLNLNGDIDPVHTPEPTTMLLLGSGLLGTAFLKKRKKCLNNRAE